MIFVAQVALYMAAKLGEHIDTKFSFAAFEAESRKVPQFALLMSFYGTTVENFEWDFDFYSLEQHICYLGNFRLNFVTPTEVAAGLLWTTLKTLP